MKNVCCTMRKKKLLVIPFCLLSLFYSCGESQEEQQLLDCIEQTWQQCETSLPEAGARAAELRDSVRNSSERVRQKYNLLLIRLRDKHDVIPSSPDSAMQVLSYFENRADDADKERAYYYLGSAYRDLKDYPQAVNCFLKTVDVARQCESADTLIWQNALSQLSHLYILLLNYEEELNVSLQAVELSQQTGKNMAFCLTDVATAYEHLKDTLHCLRLFDQAYHIIRKEHFPAKYGRTLSYMLAIYAKYNHYERVDTLLHHLSLLPAGQQPRNYEICLAKSHENANSTDSAIYYYKRYYDKEETLSGRYEASAGLQRCYLQKGDSRQAAEWGCRLYDINDSIIAQRAFEQTQRARDTYIYYRDREKEQGIMQRDERIIFASVITCLTLLSIILGLAAFYNFRKKKFMEEIVGKDKMLGVVKAEILRRQEEIESKQQEIEKLGRQLNNAEQAIAASKVQLENTMKEVEQRTMINRELTRIALMNNAASKENSLSQTEDEGQNQAKNIIAHFREVASGGEKLKANAWEELMEEIETLYPGFLEKVQGRLKRQMREPLLRTIYLLKLGMKPAQITKVMNAKIQTVWNRVKRAEATCGDLLTL